MFELFRDKRSEWRWRFRATNGRIVFITSEGYKNRKDAIAAMDLARSTNASTAMKEV